MRFFLTCLLLTTFSVQAFAQSSVVKGFVYDKANGEPMQSAIVELLGANTSLATDNNGFYSFTKVKEGSYTLRAYYSGYDSFVYTFTIGADTVLNKRIVLTKIRKTKEVGKAAVVSAKTQNKITNANVGLTKITTKEIKQLPSVGGEPDIAQYLQVLPGVTFTGDQGGQLYIRGGSPIQNKILLDGMTIYNPFHSIGLFSVFETEAIRSADVLSAGFGVDYGDRTSAIVSVNTKDGNKNRISGKVSASNILGKVFLEGPIKKAKTEDGGTVSFVASLKHSYLDKTAPFYESLNSVYKDKLPFTFTDVYGKVNVSSGAGSKFSFFGFNFKDGVNFANQYNLVWKNYGLGSNFIITPGLSSNIITGGIYYSNYDIDMKEKDGKLRNSGIGGFDANMAITSFLPNNGELKYGFELNGFSTDYDYVNFVGVNTTQNENTTQLGAFMKYKLNKNNKFIFEPGLRLMYYASLDVFSPEPRIAAKYNITRNLRLKGAIGRYSQNLISAKSDKDIVNLFTGFLTGSNEKLLKPDGSVAKNNIQYANHAIIGVEYDYKNLEFVIEPWFKDFTQLITFNRYKQTQQQSDFLMETGKAYGIDFTTKYSYGKLYFWNVLSYQKIDRFDGVQTYPTPFDRRFNVNTVGTYTTGKNKDIELSARFNYGSPLPFTSTASFFETISFTQNGLQTNYLTQNGTVELVYDNKINGGRLSHFHRVDVSARKRFTFSETNNLDVTLGVTNAYNRRNIFYVNRISNQRVYNLPLFPSASIAWNF